jgi:hypothetical protein
MHEVCPRIGPSESGDIPIFMSVKSPTRFTHLANSQCTKPFWMAYRVNSTLVTKPIFSEIRAR